MNFKFIKKTYVKYFLSYFLLLVGLMLGFFLIIRKQIVQQYFKQRCEQSLQQLDNVSEKLNSDVFYLNQIDASLRKNVAFIMSRYKTESVYRQETYQEVNKYASTTQIINSIVYFPKKTEDAISTAHLVTNDDGIINISLVSGDTLKFDPTFYYDFKAGQLILLTEGQSKLLIYFPPMSSSANYLYFFILDMDVIQQQMKMVISNELIEMALLDESGQVAVSVNNKQISDYVGKNSLSDGIHSVDKNTSLCVNTSINNNFAMVGLLSNEFMLEQIDAAFVKTYLALLILSVIGFALIILAMRITYVPLQKLTEKLVDQSEAKGGYLEQLDNTFSKTVEQNQLLREKLSHYRVSIQKSLLDSLTTTISPEDLESLSNIDAFFDTTVNKEIFAIKMASTEERFPCDEVLKFFKEMFSDKGICLLIERKQDSAVFLINYMGTEPNKAEVLLELLNDQHKEHGYLAAISNGSDSPLDIPSLYESMTQAASYWPKIPVVDYRSIPSVSSSFAYPYDEMKQLAEYLDKNDFAASRNCIDQLLKVADNALSNETNMPDFFIRSILIDILTVIFNCMGTSNIKFDSYSDLYFETLYLCRSCSYMEKSTVIVENMNKLIDFYEKEFSSRVINSVQISQIIENSYWKSDFSITVLADKFHVSVAYMSYLVKNELNQNFSDYLWNLRLKKAKELLVDTSMSIDEISVAVGYLNTSSFRRKFKQEVGMTPSQFREAGN